MIKKINFRFSVNTMLILFIIALLFNTLVLGEIIPYSIVWGGRLDSISEMQILVSISILVKLLIISTVAIKGNYIKPIVSAKVINIILWVLVLIFILNTIGNIVSINSLEAIIFTPITIASTIFCYRMIIE